MDSSSHDTPQEAEENIIENEQETLNENVEAPEALNEFDAADAEMVKEFKDNQVLRFVRVRFPGNNRSQAYYIGDNDYPLGQKVLAMSDRGMAVGFVNSFPYNVFFHKSILPIRSIAKAASAEDIKADEDEFKEERRLREIADRLIEKNQLDMALTEVELSSLGKKAIFYFTAPTRVDFRNLVHQLVSELKMRIELRQISVRDRAASVGGLGPCGRELCCSSFLAKYGNVGIKLAKNQDLSLNSSKINGVCGQLKCCLTYEDEVYQEKRKKLPRDNAIVKTKDGNAGKVVRLHILTEQFETISPDGVIRRYVADMWDGLAEGLEIPKYFENGITDNSKTVIGIDRVLAEKAAQYEIDVKEAKESAKGFADKIFQDLFGATTLDWSLPEVQEPEEANARRKIMPDEEDEIQYVVPEDEILDDDDDEDSEEDDEGNEEESESLPAPTPQRVDNHNQNRDQRPRPQHNNQGPRQPQHNNNNGGGGGGRRRRRGGGGRGGPGGGGNPNRPPQS
ncbi:MAG: hypothetical protein K2P81_05175 [Bacteriovoracaceae bacterium]|nr:hypothetical protein [Bacteriovoracaceae bacterium]